MLKRKETIMTVVLLYAGTAVGAGGFHFLASEKKMRDQLARIIPTGSSARAAKETLEGQGFHCAWETNKPWFSPDERSNYVYCDHASGPAPAQRWQVAVFHEHGHVTRIDVIYRPTGP